MAHYHLDSADTNLLIPLENSSLKVFKTWCRITESFSVKSIVALCFLDFKMHVYHLWILSIGWFWVSSFGVRPESLIPDNPPRDAAGPFVSYLWCFNLSATSSEIRQLWLCPWYLQPISSLTSSGHYVLPLSCQMSHPDFSKNSGSTFIFGL